MRASRALSAHGAPRRPVRQKRFSSTRLLVLGLVTGLVLAACGGKQERQHSGPDGPPSRGMDASDVRDAVPRYEPRSPYGNGPVYEVWGKSYRVMDSAVGYRERGIASWYGAKFHGRNTSSGEPYDLYKATAAHKTLPLPTYVEVTNLDNGKKVVVKVNDRGPFHSDRIIDLSYAAALKIGIVDQGTGRVDVRSITFDGQDENARLAKDTYLQIGAFSKKGSARNVEDDLRDQGIRDVDVKRSGGLYKVLVGPFDRASDLTRTSDRVVELGYERPHRVTR
ncbi:MAG: septal ring lytic transglycosylase RlpA family protein [Pseudomonadota bacterium]